ncbi:hypothetical protein [Nocardia africana]|uniref:Uncharacterized protein n=1 Tax=Nocardia africana TaxID=134964 RepID=A0A378X344_9NOCA|nr:hypothetical protein [Nocardia africana]MCC3311493.1 hypothetical protein [Nocardia africana]SUA47245.1 Uncharacterised protein [Nocardia africana]
MSDPITPGAIFRDNRGRWMRVDTIVDQSAILTVIAQQIGDRIVAPMRDTSMALNRLAKLDRVDTAPEPSGPDFPAIHIDRTNQTVRFGDGPELPYHIGSAGPHIKFGDDGSATVSITFRTATVLEFYGADRATEEASRA